VTAIYSTWLATYVFIAVVLYVHVFFYEGTHDKPNIAKTKRSLFSRKKYKYCGILRSWIKRIWDALDKQISRIKTRHRRHVSHFNPNRKRRTKYKLLPSWAPIAMAATTDAYENIRKEGLPFDTNSVPL
jgi:hypothetical protein